MENNEMRINDKGNIVIEFDANAPFTLRMPPWPTVRNHGGKVFVEMTPDTLIHLTEVSILTGYRQNSLRQLDGNEIPGSQRLEDGSRAWKVADVVKIWERRLTLSGMKKVR